MDRDQENDEEDKFGGRGEKTGKEKLKVKEESSPLVNKKPN